MRPTVTEQLTGLSRILSEVVAPEVSAPYPAEILGSVIQALDALSVRLPVIPGYLGWEIETIRSILSTAGLEAGPILDGAADLAALEREQARLSALLVAAQPGIAADKDGEAYRLMIAFFRERARRFPFSMAARPPAKKE